MLLKYKFVESNEINVTISSASAVPVGVYKLPLTCFTLGAKAIEPDATDACLTFKLIVWPGAILLGST